MKAPFYLILCLGASLSFGQTPPSASPAVPSAAMIEKREKRFSKLDLNNDSFVDRDEFNKSRQAQKKANRAEKRFTGTDANNDGKLSKEEWLAAPARKGKGKSTSA